MLGTEQQQQQIQTLPESWGACAHCSAHNRSLQMNAISTGSILYMVQPNDQDFSNATTLAEENLSTTFVEHTT